MADEKSVIFLRFVGVILSCLLRAVKATFELLKSSTWTILERNAKTGLIIPLVLVMQSGDSLVMAFSFVMDKQVFQTMLFM